MEYRTSGKLTFFINEANTVWRNDTGGKPLETVPSNPRAEGWGKVD